MQRRWRMSHDNSKEYRLQTSFAIKNVRDKSVFYGMYNAFRRFLSEDKRIKHICTRDNVNDRRITISFDIDSDSFKNANLTSGRIILEALKKATVNTGDLSEIERIKRIDNASELDAETGKIVSDQSTALSLV